MDITFITKIYKYTLSSFFFWIYLARGFGIYGLVPACCSLIAVIEDIKMERDHDQVLKLFSSYYHSYKRYTFLSFCFSIFFIFSYTSLFLINMQDGAYAIILSLVVLYLFCLSFVMLTFFVNLLVLKDFSLKEAMIYSLFFSMKYFWISVLLVLIVSLLTEVAKLNFFFFICFAPIIYGFCSRLFFELINKQDNTDVQVSKKI